MLAFFLAPLAIIKMLKLPFPDSIEMPLSTVFFLAWLDLYNI